MGSLGSNHFILIVQNSSWTETIYLFKRSNFSIEKLSEYAMPNNRDWWGGHPIDKTRYLLRFRSVNSAGSVTYQLIIRESDSITFGNAIQRPDFSEFPGLDQGEPQTFSPLIKLNNSQYREIRAGYVYNPGYLSSWKLSITDDNNMTSSEIKVYNNSEIKTMEPLVTSDNNGNAVIAYNSYGNGWHYGYITDNGDYIHKGFLSDESNYFSRQSKDSSEGFINNKYYIRMQSGKLFKFDNFSSNAVKISDDLKWTYCNGAPSIIKSGQFGVFLVCDGEKPLNLTILNLNN